MRIQKIYLSAVATFVVAGLCLIGTSAGISGAASKYKTGASITYGIDSDWQNFNVQTVDDGITQELLQNAYATLLAQTPSGTLEPYMASKWTATASKIVFTLKKGMTCSDGTPVTPQVVANSLQHMINIKAINNAVLWGPGPYKVAASAKADTVTFSVGTPYSPLAYGFSDSFPGSMTGIVCPAGLKSTADLKTKMYGAGPYTLVSATHGVGVTFKLRKNFTWGPAGMTSKTPGVPATVNYKIVTDPTTLQNLLQTGSVQVAGISGSGSTKKQLLADKSLQSSKAVAYVLNALTFNETAGHPTDDIALRHALITAIDPSVWYNNVDEGLSVQSHSVFPPGDACYDSAVNKLAPTPSVTAAAAILAGAGYTLSGGKLMLNGSQVTINLVMTNLFDPGPAYIQSQWQQLGINVVLTDGSYLPWVEALISGNFDVSMVETASPGAIVGPAAQRMVGAPPSQGGTNYTWSDDAALNADAATGLKTTSCGAWDNFQTQIWKNWDMLPLSEPYTYTFSNKVSMTLGTYPVFLRVLS
jgi:peptide/nickel transport system substrate-binding protein